MLFPIRRDGYPRPASCRTKMSTAIVARRAQFDKDANESAALSGVHPPSGAM